MRGQTAKDQRYQKARALFGQKKKHGNRSKLPCFSGGEGGIRTLETLLRPTRFPIVRARPNYATSPRICSAPSNNIQFRRIGNDDIIASFFQKSRGFFRFFKTFVFSFPKAGPAQLPFGRDETDRNGLSQRKAAPHEASACMRSGFVKERGVILLLSRTDAGGSRLPAPALRYRRATGCCRPRPV